MMIPAPYNVFRHDAKYHGWMVRFSVGGWDWRDIFVEDPAPVEMCACGHPKTDHATASHRGLCFECYDRSDHGAVPYCNRYRRPKVGA